MSEQQLLDIATQLAREAGDLIYKRRQQGVNVAATKSSVVDVVTAADRECEQYLRDRISELRPQDGFYGEESDPLASESGITWVVDPIDGTVNYLYGLPHYAVSIAAVAGNPAANPAEFEVLAGAVYAPALQKLYSAHRGGGAKCNDVPIYIGDAPEDLARTLVATGFAYEAEVRKLQAEAWLGLADRVRDLRRNGAASLDLCAVASGTIDVYYEFGLKPWDWAAGSLVLAEAGGKICGKRVEMRESCDIVVAGHPRILPVFHEALFASAPRKLIKP